MEDLLALKFSRNTAAAVILQLADVRGTSARSCVDIVGVLDAKSAIGVLVESCG